MPFTSPANLPADGLLRHIAASMEGRPPAPPPPPPKGAISLKVFPRKALGSAAQILQLRTLLPEFDILQGRSGMTGTDAPWDVLFVNRDRVSEQAVLEVIRALQEIGVFIKSVQQRVARPDDIQLGTIKHRFSNSEPLNVQQLSSLSGDTFWKAAFNGQAWCGEKPEETAPCPICTRRAAHFSH
jgi:hypothetical protein